MSSFRFALFFTLTLFFCTPLTAQMRIAFWNVENYFDTRNDTLTDDDDFTPDGERHWTRKRFDDKRDAIAKTIIAMQQPVVVGLAEVENDYVLSQLCTASPLRKFAYKYVHFESPDRRGIDCALLYRKQRVRLLESQAFNVSNGKNNLRTRDLLMAMLLVDKRDTLVCFVCHLPSRLSGKKSEKQRATVAACIRKVVDSVAAVHPQSELLLMGDFNATQSEVAKLTSDCCLRSLMSQEPKARGSYYYQGHWQLLDHILARPSARTSGKQAIVFEADFLMQKDEKRKSRRPFRTFLGPKYLGGISDHLPVLIDL